MFQRTQPEIQLDTRPLAREESRQLIHMPDARAQEGRQHPETTGQRGPVGLTKTSASAQERQRGRNGTWLAPGLQLSRVRGEKQEEPGESVQGASWPQSRIAWAGGNGVPRPGRGPQAAPQKQAVSDGKV